jgi:hypothetical protein
VALLLGLFGLECFVPSLCLLGLIVCCDKASGNRLDAHDDFAEAVDQFTEEGQNGQIVLGRDFQ